MAKVLAAASSEGLTAETLPLAIGHLLELNNYSVRYGVSIHGAEIDIVATPKSDPFQSKIYIEATVQYVNNIKYGKDLTKFSLIRNIDQNAVVMSVSASGFTKDVTERAEKTRIITETYNSLFRQFERFSDYIDLIQENKEIAALSATYEPPRLDDYFGSHDAISWFESWQKERGKSSWVVLLGEYGTGKTALTLYLQRKWLTEYKKNPTSRIPIRIELRSFTRQFDANSLLHHFLDSNMLSHIPLDYLRHLIRSGRVIMLLDGYDEMAQFMNARERRACLSALADLANSGAIGILTSRPNYFTEAEELNVFDALYASLEKSHYYSGKTDIAVLDEEKQIDYLLENYLINKKERHLRDLNEMQTKSLVQKKLSGDKPGQDVILGILSRVFRSEGDGRQQSLSGKPVIVSFLLELIDELKKENENSFNERLTEWSTYKMIVDRLMLRDLRRSPNVYPEFRRLALQRLALLLSTRDTPMASEDDFFAIIDDVFRQELRRHQGEEKRARRDELFQDIRSSATLTRLESRGISRDYWSFSHNSIREYLVSEAIISSINSDFAFRHLISISDAMRQFIASIDETEIISIFKRIKSHWRDRDRRSASSFVLALWKAICQSEGGAISRLVDIFGAEGANIDFSGLSLSRIDISSSLEGFEVSRINFNNSEISAFDFLRLDFGKSSFFSTVLDTGTFRQCKLEGASFHGAYIFECTFFETSFEGADFRGLERGSNFSVQLQDGLVGVLADEAAIGYLRYRGAITDDVAPYFVAMHHPKFSIVQKICDNISDQKNSQLRGLTQRGAAQADPAFARSFVDFMRSRQFIELNSHDLVSATSQGRGAIMRLLNHNELFDGLYEFLMRY